MSIKSRLRLPRNESDRWHQPVDLSWSKHTKTLHKDFTGANRGNGEGELSLCSLRSLLFKSGPGDFLVWQDKFKTAVLAQAATFGLVVADTTPITNDNTDIHAKVTSVNSTSAIATQAVADKDTSRTNANDSRFWGAVPRTNILGRIMSK